MGEHESGRIEISRGELAPATASDRIVVGLAILALMGGALILLGTLVGTDREPPVAEASPTPSPSPMPSPSSTPRARAPTPVAELTLAPGTPPEPLDAQQPGFWSLVRAEVDLVIRAQPLPDAEELGVLAAGEAAVIDATPATFGRRAGWARVVEPAPGGWIATADGATSLVDRLDPPAPGSGYITNLVAGPNEWLAFGWQASGGDRLGRSFGAVSSDGRHWDELELQAGRGWHELTHAWGPIGWLAVGRVHQPGRGLALWIWQSDDARNWTPLGAMRGIAGDRSPIQLVANERAYVLIESRGWWRPMRVWVSGDGLRWQASQLVDIGIGHHLRLVATPVGFYGWTDPSLGPIVVDDRRLAEPQVAAFSPDGERWVSVPGGPGPWNVQLAGAGNELLAFDVGPDGRTRAWIGSVVNGRLPETATIIWREDTLASADFEHATVSALASDGARATAFGWDRRTGVRLSWTHHESGWQAVPLPDGMNAIPRIAAAGTGGMVVVGARPTPSAENPIVWHRAPDGEWAPEATPLLGAH
jgi:hypothetical protein